MMKKRIILLVMCICVLGTLGACKIKSDKKMSDKEIRQS